MKEDIKNKALGDHLIGQYVLIRSRNEGLNAGFLEACDETGCVITEARRLWKPISKDLSLAWYEGVAVSGLHPDKSIISGKVDKKVIIEEYSITTCSDVAKENIRSFKANETTY